MPKRPIQHKLEDLSRTKFQLAIPRNWAFRNKDKDYGIDGEVELFDSSDKAQGLLFYVQLKATESKSEATIMNVDFKIETLSYYKKLDIPVLLVRYSEHKDSFYIKWINNVDFFFIKEKAKTIRIKLEEKDIWTANSFEKIEKKLINRRQLKYGNFNFPIPLSIEINENEIKGYSKSILLTQLKKELKHYNEYLNLDFGEDSAITVSLNKEELNINMSDLSNCTFHSIDLRQVENFAKGISQDILFGSAICLKKIGQIDKCGKIIFDNKLQHKLIENKELSFILLSALFSSSYFEKVIDLMEEICDNDNSSELALISNVNILTSSRTSNISKKLAIELFLKNRIKTSIKQNNISQIGISHYNLGNFYRGQGSFYESVKNYIAAKRFEPKYLNQEYYFHELAGVLFLEERYSISAKLYLKAIELGGNELSKILYADALMYSGKYQESVDVFLNLDDTKDLNDEFQLKFLCLRIILEKKNLKTQNRKKDEANNLAKISNDDNLNVAKEKLDKALDLDLLCGLAWFNLGRVQAKEVNFADAMFSFIMAGIIYDNDIEAWKNATICAFYTKEEPFFIGLIIRTAYHFNKEEYLEKLYEDLEKNSGLKDISEITKVIEAILPKQENKKDAPVVRVLNEKGIFENIFEK